MRTPFQRPGMWWAALLALAAVFTLLVFHLAEEPAADGAIYRAMAMDPLKPVPAPFGRRVLVPFVVWALPLSTRLAFSLITAAALTGTAALLWRTSRTLAVKPWVGPAAFLLFLVSPASIIHLENPYLVDPAAYLVFAGAMLLLVERRWRAVIALVCLGVSVRETSLLLLLPWSLAVVRAGRISLLPWMVLPLLVFLGLRFIEVDGELFELSAAQVQRVLSHKRETGGLLPNVVAAVVLSGALLLAPAWAGWRALPRRSPLRALPWLLIPVCLALPFVTDTHRMILLLSPAICLFAATGCRSLAEAIGWAAVVMTGAAALVFLPSGHAAKTPVVLASLGAGALLTAYRFTAVHASGESS